jgi:hypothetical protein
MGTATIGMTNAAPRMAMIARRESDRAAYNRVEAAVGGFESVTLDGEGSMETR